MTDKKTDPTSDAARTGSDADKNRNDLLKQAERGIKDASKDSPDKDV